MAKRILFFSLRSEMNALFSQISSGIPVAIARVDFEASLDASTFDPCDFPFELEKTYLVISASAQPQKRAVQQRAGGVRYAVDQVNNPDSVAFRAGGRVGDNMLVAGEVSTISEATLSKKLFLAFQRETRNNFEKVGAYYVSPLAAAMLDSGARLVYTSKAASEYDLRRPQT